MPNLPTLRPVFILGSPGSGKDYLCAALGQHPLAFDFAEINLLTYDSLKHFWEHTEGNREFMRDGLLRLISQLFAAEQSIQGIDMAKRWLFSRITLPAIQIYKEFLTLLQPVTVFDCSTAYIANPENLAKILLIFPKARFIHLVRHPLQNGIDLLTTGNGMYLSYAEQLDTLYDTSATPEILDVQYYWYEQQSMIHQFLETIPSEQHMRVRYEEFNEKPKQVLSRILNKLDLTADATIVDAMRPELSPFAHFGPSNANLGYHASFLAKPTIQQNDIETTLSSEMTLPWRKQGGFSEKVKVLAKQFGYRHKKGDFKMADQPKLLENEKVSMILNQARKQFDATSSTPFEIREHRKSLEYRISMLSAFCEEAKKELAELPEPENNA